MIPNPKDRETSKGVKTLEQSIWLYIYKKQLEGKKVSEQQLLVMFTINSVGLAKILPEIDIYVAEQHEMAEFRFYAANEPPPYISLEQKLDEVENLIEVELKKKKSNFGPLISKRNILLNKINMPKEYKKPAVNFLSDKKMKAF